MKPLFEAIKIDFPYADDREWCSQHLLHARFAMAAISRTPEQFLAGVRKLDNAEAWLETRRNLRITAAHLTGLAEVCHAVRWRIWLSRRLAAEPSAELSWIEPGQSSW